MKILVYIFRLLSISILLSVALFSSEAGKNWKPLKLGFYTNIKGDLGYKVSWFNGDNIEHFYLTHMNHDENSSKLKDVIDIASLKRITFAYFKDKNHVYRYYDGSNNFFTIEKGADLSTFAYIDGVYLKDKNHIYTNRLGKIEVDYDSFTMFDVNHSTSDYCAADKDGYIYRGKRVIDTNDSDFLIKKNILDSSIKYRPSIFDSAGDFVISIANSGIDYPTKGDEHLVASYGQYKYYADISHPQLMDDSDFLHFSTPFFRIYDANNTSKHPMYLRHSLQILPTDASPLSWHSGYYGYFFAQRRGKLRGFMLEDGMDNQDGYATGILFTFDGNRSKSYYWGCNDGRNTGFNITDAKGGKSQPALKKLLKPLLDYAYKRADGWPGP